MRQLYIVKCYWNFIVNFELCKKSTGDGLVMAKSDFKMRFPKAISNCALQSSKFKSHIPDHVISADKKLR
jgi:hypothetical protein